MGRTPKPVRMTEVQKASLLNMLAKARFDKEVDELHYALRCHFYWEDETLGKDTGLTGTPAADFDPTLEQDSELAQRFNELIERYLKMGGSIPAGFREALWGLCAEVGEIPPLPDVAAARLMFHLTAQTERRRWAKKLAREEMPKDCIACSEDQPCQACMQTARIVGMLEARV
jgi:hypothetical protein